MMEDSGSNKRQKELDNKQMLRMYYLNDLKDEWYYEEDDIYILDYGIEKSPRTLVTSVMS